MKFTKEGKPILKMGDFEFVLTSVDSKKVAAGEYNKIMVVKHYTEDETPKSAKSKGKKKAFSSAVSHEKKQSEITDIDLKGLGTDKMSTKDRNKLSKVFKKYIENGVIKKDKAEELQKELASFKLEENDILNRIIYLIG